MRLLDRVILNNTWTGEVPYMLPIIRHPLVQRLVPRFREQTAELRKLGMFARSCVSARKARGSDDRKDMLTYTLEAHRKKPESYTESDLTSDAHTIVFAGSDTTAIVHPPMPLSKVLISGPPFNILPHVEDPTCLQATAGGNRPSRRTGQTFRISNLCRISHTPLSNRSHSRSNANPPQRLLLYAPPRPPGGRDSLQ